MPSALTFVVTGADATIKALGNLKQIPVKKGSEALMGGLRIAERTAKILSPVDTGRMRASITPKITRADTTGLEGELRAKTNYAVYVELGTKNMAAQPFIWPATEGNFQNITNKFAEILGKEIQHLVVR